MNLKCSSSAIKDFYIPGLWMKKHKKGNKDCQHRGSGTRTESGNGTSGPGRAEKLPCEVEKGETERRVGAS